MFSAVCSALASTRPPSTGHRISHRRREASGGVCARFPPKHRRASPRQNRAMRVQLTASLRAVAPSTSVQRSPASRPGVAYRAAATAPMRTVCSANWLATLGPTRRRARKNPRSTADTAIHGRPSADSRSAPAARTSPSHHLAASPARPACAAMASTPSPAPSASRRRSMPRADAASRLSSSVSRRVAAAEMPAVASVTNSPYTASTSWYRPMPSPPSALASPMRSPSPARRSTTSDPVSRAAFFQ